MTARRTPPRGTPAPAVLAGGVHRLDDGAWASAERLPDTAKGHVRGLTYRITPSTEHATAADGLRVRLLAVHVEGSRVGYAADLATALAMVAQHAGAERVELPPAPADLLAETVPDRRDPRDRGVDSAGTAALAEEVARLRAELGLAWSELDRLTATIIEGGAELDRRTEPEVR